MNPITIVHAISVSLLLATGFSPPEVAAQSNVFVRFPDFSSTQGLTVNGNPQTVATEDGNVLRLVRATTWQAGSVFSTVRVNAGTFSTYFSFRFTGCGGTGAGADGLVFVIQSIANDLGASGGGMGYNSIGKSVGVEFDIYDNSVNGDPIWGDHLPVTRDSHTAIDVGGVFLPSPPDGGYASVSPNMKDGTICHAWIDYDGTAVEVRVSRSDQRPSEPLATRILNVTNEIKAATAYIGFTAATGTGYANHDLLAWQFNSTFDPITNIPKVIEMNIWPAVEIGWNSESGRNYRVWWTSNLVGTDWLALTNVIGVGPTNTVFDSTRQNGQRFYRVTEGP